MSYQFCIDFEPEVLPEHLRQHSVLSMTAYSKVYEVEEEMIADCNKNVELLLLQLKDKIPDVSISKIKNDGSEEFDEDEICKIVFFNQTTRDAFADEIKTSSDILDLSFIYFSIFHVE
jgi:acetolactate synthase regulatory subunit